MADFNTKILLELQDKTAAALAKVDRNLDRLNKKAASFGNLFNKNSPDLRNLNKLEKALASVERTGQRASLAVKGIAAGAGFAGIAEVANKAGQAAQNASIGFDFLGKTVKANLSAVNGFGEAVRNATGFIEPLDQALKAAGASGVTTAAGIALATTALVAFLPQIRSASEAVKPAEKIASAFAGTLGTVSVKLQEAVPLIQKATSNISNLTSRQTKLKSALDQNNSNSEVAAKIGARLVDINARLNVELREQADLLRRVAGVNVTELEASKGRNSIATKKRREEYLAEKATAQESAQTAQLRDQQVLMQSLAALEQRGVSALEEKLAVNRRITNELSLQKQKEKNSQLQGQSMRIPTPYTNAAGQGFPGVALPQTKQEAKIAAAERERAEARVALARQKSTALLTKDTFALQMQLAIIEKMGLAYDDNYKKQKRANERQSQLFRGRANRTQRQDLGSQNLALAQKVDKLATNRLLKTNLQNKAFEIGVAIRKNEFTLAKKLMAESEKLLANEEKRIDAAKRLLKFNQKQRKAKKGTGGTGGGGNGGMGGLGAGIGFPLLFGGGPGSVLGGAVGSAGGFGTQILASAIGGIVDAYVASVADLGSALNPATADTNKLVEALGATNTPFANLVKDLEDSGRGALALALATEKMANLVGQDGVDALKEFGTDATELGNEFAKAMTVMSASVANFINESGILKAITDQLGRANIINQARNSGNPEQQERFQRFEQAGVGFGTGVDPLAKAKEREAIIQEIVEAQLKLNAAAEREAQVRATLAKFDATKIREIRASVAEKRIGLEIEQLNAEANDTTRIALEKSLAVHRRRAEVQDLYNQFARDEIDITVLRLKLDEKQIEYETEILRIKNAAAAASAKALKAAASAAASAPKSKALQLEQQITQEQLKQADLINKRIGLAQGEKAELTSRVAFAQGKTDAEKKIIELQREQALLSNKFAGDVDKINEKYDAQLQTLLLRNQLDKENYEQRLKALALEEKMAGVKGTRAVDDFTLGANRQIEDISMQMANPFGGDELERMQLQVQQTREYDDRVKELTRSIEDLNAQQELAPTDARAKEIEGVQNLLSKYRELTPAIFEAQQQQLKLNQTIEMLQPVTSALASGISNAITGVIDGTKTVEEAFSEMFANIGKAFIDMATQMLAQQAVLALLKAFTGGSPLSTTGTKPGLPFFEARTPGLASGGAAIGNKPYLVGETGPELFVPQTSGRVVNNSDSQMALDRYSYQDNSPTQPSQPIKIEYTSTSMAGEEYVTAAQFQQGIAAAAKQGAKSGETRVMASLRNSRSRRKAIGI